MARMAHWLVRSGLAALHGHRLRALLGAAEEPAAAQSIVLRDILAENAQTSFGERHGFAGIRTPADYRRAVPVQTYEDLREDIEAQELTGEPRLTVDRPVYYNRTSGTVATPKNIPVTGAGLKRIQGHQRLAAYAFSKGPPILAGKMFAVTGTAVEGHMPGGTPFGSASGLLYQNQPRLLRARYVLPPEISSLEDYEQRYLAMAALGMAEANVTCAATPNASTLVKMLEVVNRHPDDLLAALADGRVPGVANMASPKADPIRAARLSRVLHKQGSLEFSDIWPNLAGVVTWTGGSCGIAIGNLKPSLPKDCVVIELGYVASEVHGTVNVDPESNICLPTLADTFFEFVERDAWEGERARVEFLGLEDLEDGRDYYVFVTTTNGLYRYDMNDIVRVSGRVGRTPALDFVQKGKGVTSITGEKLHEMQVLDAVGSVLEERGIGCRFFIVLADPATASYTLYIEPHESGPIRDIAGEVDTGLRRSNVEYDSKRASMRLLPLRQCPLKPGTGDAFRAGRVAAGQRDAQFKYLHLQYADDCGFDFAAWMATGE